MSKNLLTPQRKQQESFTSLLLVDGCSGSTSIVSFIRKAAIVRHSFKLSFRKLLKCLENIRVKENISQLSYYLTK